MTECVTYKKILIVVQIMFKSTSNCRPIIGFDFLTYPNLELSSNPLISNLQPKGGSIADLGWVWLLRSGFMNSEDIGKFTCLRTPSMRMLWAHASFESLTNNAVHERTRLECLKSIILYVGSANQLSKSDSSMNVSLNIAQSHTSIDAEACAWTASSKFYHLESYKLVRCCCILLIPIVERSLSVEK